MITIRTFDRSSDYSLVCAWWKGHGWDSPPLAFLPALGVLACKDGHPVAAGWCYLDNSCPVAKMEWLVADPEGRVRDIIAGLNAVIEFLTKRVQEPDLGYSIMLTTARQPGLCMMLEKHDFVVTDGGMTHLLLVLDPEARAKFKAMSASNEAIPGTVLATFHP